VINVIISLNGKAASSMALPFFNHNGNDLICEDRIALWGVLDQLKSVDTTNLIFPHQRLNWLNGI
jgi:hypothetical protein